MIVNDKVYGKVKIEEPVLLDLLKSPVILRTKNISQYGVPDKYYHHKNFSRYEHTVGVMCLLRRVGATLEEQIAGLLHDVSHFAFSHVVDWVFKEANNNLERLHDEAHHKFLENSDIPKILKKHGFLLERVSHEANYSLLEQDAPELCGDRVDYSLREMVDWYNPTIVKKCLPYLANFNGKLIFTDREAAFLFAGGYMDLQSEHWGEYQAVFRYLLFSKAVRICVKEKLLTKKDLYQDEKFALKKLESSQNPEVKELLKTLRGKPDGYKFPSQGQKLIVKKFRFVDPLFLEKGKLLRLSKSDTRYRRLLEKHRKINLQGVLV